MLVPLRVALIWLAISITGSTALSQADLRYRSIYQVVTDRFARSDNQNMPCDPGARDYCGGTWRGIVGKLDYIQEMGFDTGKSSSRALGSEFKV